MITILFALGAAFSNALNMITQHIASTSDPGHSKGWQFVRYLVSNPLWLFGWVALGGSFVFQALALHNGQMSVVQPLLVTELVFALVLRRLWIRQQIRNVTWWAAAHHLRRPWRCSSPWPSRREGMRSRPARPGSAPPSPPAGRRPSWPWSGMRGSPVRRAAALGAATAILWALVATFIKAMTDTLTQFGVFGMFAHWPVYALIVVSITRRAARPDRTPRRAAEHFAAVHRDRRPHREHCAQRLDLRRGLHRERIPADRRHRVLRRHVRCRRSAGAHHAGDHGARAGARCIASSEKKLTQLVRMDAPSATMVARQTSRAAWAAWEHRERTMAAISSAVPSRPVVYFWSKFYPVVRTIARGAVTRDILSHLARSA